MIVLESGYDDIQHIVKQLNGTTILTYGIEDYDYNELYKIFSYIGINLYNINSLDETLQYKYDVLILNTNIFSLISLISDIKLYNIDNKKMLLIKYYDHLDYELLDILDCKTINYPINYLDFIKNIYSVIL